MLTTEPMKTVFFEALGPGDGLVDGATGDMDRYWPVEDGVKVGNGFGARKLFDAGFDDGERRSVMTVNEISVKKRYELVGYSQGSQVRKMFNLFVRLFVDDDRLGIISPVNNSVADVYDLAFVYAGVILQTVQEVRKGGGMVVYRFYLFVLVHFFGARVGFKSESGGRCRDIR